MRLFLIRHGETEHNVAGLLAGVTDSLLTNHGLIQAQRLGTHLIKKKQYRFSQVFASDLKRAARTANEICLSQNAECPELRIAPIELSLLRERNFGSFELLPWNRASEIRQQDPKETDDGFEPKETAAAMKVRADTFLDDSLLPLLALDNESEQFVAVVSHGLFLAALWRALLSRFKPSSVSLGPGAVPIGSKKPLEHLPDWSNTGCLELSLQAMPSVDGHKPAEEASNPGPEATATTTSSLLDNNMKIIAVNNKDHLMNLKRTRGGVGSSTSDDKQKRLDGFFKKRKVGERPLNPPAKQSS